MTEINYHHIWMVWCVVIVARFGQIGRAMIAGLYFVNDDVLRVISAHCLKSRVLKMNVVYEFSISELKKVLQKCPIQILSLPCYTRNVGTSDGLAFVRGICESSNTLTHLEIYEHLWDKAAAFEASAVRIIFEFYGHSTRSPSCGG